MLVCVFLSISLVDHPVFGPSLMACNGYLYISYFSRWMSQYLMSTSLVFQLTISQSHSWVLNLPIYKRLSSAIPWNSHENPENESKWCEHMWNISIVSNDIPLRSMKSPLLPHLLVVEFSPLQDRCGAEQAPLALCRCRPGGAQHGDGTDQRLEKYVQAPGEVEMRCLCIDDIDDIDYVLYRLCIDYV